MSGLSPNTNAQPGPSQPDMIEFSTFLPDPLQVLLSPDLLDLPHNINVKFFADTRSLDCFAWQSLK